jgi:hypothetical protein
MRRRKSAESDGTAIMSDFISCLAAAITAARWIDSLDGSVVETIVGLPVAVADGSVEG